MRLTEEEDLPATPMTAVAPEDEGLRWAEWEAAHAETDQPRRVPPRTRALRGSESLQLLCSPLCRSVSRHPAQR